MDGRTTCSTAVALAMFVLGAGCNALFGIEEGVLDVPEGSAGRGANDSSAPPDQTNTDQAAPAPEASKPLGDAGSPDATGTDALDSDAPDALDGTSGGSGAVGSLGKPCPTAAALACAGNAQKTTLICSGGNWTLASTCPIGQNCNSSPGPNQGTCAPIVAVCTSASPGSNVCGSSTTVVQCGPDLVSDSAVQTCTNQACVAGVCAGLCSPGTMGCASATQFAMCNPTGQWDPATVKGCGTTVPYCKGGTCVQQPPSCQAGGAGMTNCGAGSESCCTSLPVTGGPFYRTYMNSGAGPTAEADPATVSNFRLDKYLVTVGRFRQFVSAWNGGAGYTPPAGSGKHTHLNGGNGLAATGGGYEPGWAPPENAYSSLGTGAIAGVAPTDASLGVGWAATWMPSPGSQENLPINNENWYEAYAFCTWDGGFLPSTAESVYAAAGGGQQREYPWGSTPPGGANQYAICTDPTGYCQYPSLALCSGVKNIAPVGFAAQGAGLWGQVDLTGDVREWTLDWFVTPYVAGVCTDCADLTPGTNWRAVHGGAFDWGGDPVSSFTQGVNPDTRSGDIGVRCARTP